MATASTDELIDRACERIVCEQLEGQEKAYQYAQLVEAVARAAAEYAKRAGLEVHKYEYGVGVEAIALVDSLRDALTPATFGQDEFDRVRDEVRHKAVFWRHKTYNPNSTAERKNRPPIDNVWVEGITTRYLDGPWRCREMDRLLLDILIAMEMYAYVDEMVNKPPFGLPSRSPLHWPHPLWSYVLGWLWSLGGLGVVAGSLYGAEKLGVLGYDWAVGLMVGFIGLTVLALTLRTLALPFNWRRVQKARRIVLNALRAMMSVYGDLNTQGAISARHIREGMETSSREASVVWPAPAYALLDDVEQRGGRL